MLFSDHIDMLLNILRYMASFGVLRKDFEYQLEIYIRKGRRVELNTPHWECRPRAHLHPDKCLHVYTTEHQLWQHFWWEITVV